MIDSAVKDRDLHDYWPSNDVIENALRLEDEMETTLERGRTGILAQENIDRRWKDGTFDKMMAEHTMYRGSLQIAASGLLGQNTQQQAGEREFYEAQGALRTSEKNSGDRSWKSCAPVALHLVVQ